jgi:hypothetical protein
MLTLAVLVVGLAAASTATEVATAASSSKTVCAAHLDYGYGIKASFVVMGHPSWIVRGTCSAVRSSGWKSGIALGTPRLICGGTMRSNPGVNAALFSTATYAPIARMSCSKFFGRRYWDRYR